MPRQDRVVFLAEWAVLSATLVALARPLISDQVYYLDKAQSLAAGHGLVGAHGLPTAFITPGFPVLLAAFVLGFGAHAVQAFRLFQALLLAGAAWVGQDTLRLLGMGRRSRLLAQLALAFYVPFVLSASEPVPEAFANLLTISQFWFLARALRARPGTPARARAGLLAALAVTSFVSLAVRPTALLFTLALCVLAAVSWATRDGSRRVVTALALTVLLADAAFVAGWGLRNLRGLGEFIPFSTEGSWVAYNGNDFAADGMGGVNTFRREAGDALADSLDALPEAARSHYFSAALLRELRTHAADVPLLWAKKLARLWLNLGFPNRPSVRSLLVAPFNLALLVLLPRGIARLWPRGAGQGRAWCVAVLAFAGILTAVHVATFALVRYAFPALSLLLLLGAVAVAEPRETASGPAA